MLYCIVKKFSKGLIVGLTAFKDKVFVKCIHENKNICEDEIQKDNSSYEPSLA